MDVVAIRASSNTDARMWVTNRHDRRSGIEHPKGCGKSEARENTCQGQLDELEMHAVST